MKKIAVISMRSIIDKLYKDNYLSGKELLYVLNEMNEDDKLYLIKKAHETRMKTYGDKVFLRGLIEFTNYCKRNCRYCGIRALNKNADRYRLTVSEIIEACEKGYNLGYRTFVLQGGEDEYFTDEKIVDMVTQIKTRFKSCAITLSIGEKSYSSYKKYFDAGADRYLIRHETA